MKKAIIITFSLIFFCFGSVYSQQDVQFSHNMFNTMGINPGYAGLRSAICATALARQQWVGFRDSEGNRVSPETYSLNVDAPIPFLKGGAAIGFIQDELGFETNVGVKITYAYHHQMVFGKLGIGAQIGFWISVLTSQNSLRSHRATRYWLGVLNHICLLTLPWEDSIWAMITCGAAFLFLSSDRLQGTLVKATTP
jgi:type IX secretion system PorP/SprF family membrane protein